MVGDNEGSSDGLVEGSLLGNDEGSSDDFVEGWLLGNNEGFTDLLIEGLSAKGSCVEEMKQSHAEEIEHEEEAIEQFSLQ